MVISVFIHPVFLFSYSTMSNCVDQKPTAQGARWIEQSQAEVPPGQDLRIPPLQPNSCGLLGWPQTIRWHHYLVLGQQDSVLPVVFYPNDQKTNSETPQHQAYKKSVPSC